MNTEELNKYIDAYFYGQLSQGEEVMLFSSLAGNFEARQYFKEQHILKAAFRMMDEPFPASLDEEILKAAASHNRRGLMSRYAQPAAIAASAASLLFLLFIFLIFGRMESYKYQMDNAMIEIKNQKQTIELLMNGLPTIQVTANSSKGYILSNN